MNPVYDIAVVGSGFAGSLFAMIAHRLGRSVILIERGRHPRVVVGESSTPLSNLLLEDLAERYDLLSLEPLTKWGSWQQSYPDLACGLKRGFTFFHHDLKDPEHRDAASSQLFVEASPHDRIADTHWFRAEFDEFLVHEAQKQGIDFVDEVKLQEFVEIGDEVLLKGSREGENVVYRTRFVVDATGPRGFLHRALGLSEAPLPGYPATEALYGHFSNVTRLDSLRGRSSAQAPPYPVDDAAVHHVFDGGWIWVLQFNNGITSAGIAATAACGNRLGLRDDAAQIVQPSEKVWKRLIAKIPALKEQFAMAQLQQPFTHVRRLSFRSSAVTGRRWAMLPSAAGFIDPLLSTGFPLTLLGVGRLAAIMERSWCEPDLASQLDAYGTETQEDLLATARLVAALYANMGNFPVFRSLSLLYFAAASFSETARRLGKPHLADSFLLRSHPTFGPACRTLLDRATRGVPTSDSEAFAREVLEVIDPIDLAGLCKAPHNSSYPVVAQDLIDSAWKLGATQADVICLLDRAGFYEAQST